MTTYSQKHRDMNCPYCRKPLIESEYHNEVACSDPKCIFNYMNIEQYIKK